MKLSKSEAGKLGAAKSLIICREMATKRRENYLLSPTICKVCQQFIPYEKQLYKFCSRSCAAKFNNYNVQKRHGPLPSINKIPKRTMLDRINDEKEKRKRLFFSGSLVDRGTIRRCMYEFLQLPHQCNQCKHTTWNEKPIPIEVDHIDGDPSNNSYTNFQFLCPNCHAQTPFWKGRNRGNGRKSKGVPEH